MFRLNLYSARLCCSLVPRPVRAIRVTTRNDCFKEISPTSLCIWWQTLIKESQPISDAFFHFFKNLGWSRILGLTPPFWICHYLPGVLGEFFRQAWQVTSHPKSPRTTGNEAGFVVFYLIDQVGRSVRWRHQKRLCSRLNILQLMQIIWNVMLCSQHFTCHWKLLVMYVMWLMFSKMANAERSAAVIHTVPLSHARTKQ